MTTLLVANRGEIARRIIRTARRLGMRTVAVHSEADAGLPFVREADGSVRIGPAQASDSYLAIDRIIAAAREAKADLVHPGYGFLSERPDLASAVDAAGLRFVGPPAAVLSALGDKAQAKAIAERAGVPVLPDYRGAAQDDEAFARSAREIGYPVMVKPVAGGGGIGMQAVTEASALRPALARARRLASGAFGDERLLLEKLVSRARHVEVQVLADEHGGVVDVGERDCTLQRRHQKIVEICPAPAVDPNVTAAIRRSAVAIAREAGYRNAGTVEFLINTEGRFFFIEVNARLQVEHPVTEVVFDVDLVEQQLRVALGERVLPSKKAKGSAIEARIYAEDPPSGFLPSTGRLLHVRWPSGNGIRIDAGYEEGDVVTHHYDPLLAKVIARGDDTDGARTALARALEETEVLGVRTNVGFLRALLGDPDVRAQRLDTGLVERELPSLVPQASPAPAEAFAVAAAAIAVGARATTDPWTSQGPWRIGGSSGTTIVLRDGRDERPVRLTGTDSFEHAGHRLDPGDEPHRWLVDGSPATAASAGATVWTSLAGSVWMLESGPREVEVEHADGGEVAAPMPGVVIAAHAEAGRRVRRGELLFVVEAMKMELRVEAPDDGTVTRVLARAGQQVQRGQRLAEFEPVT